MALSKEELRLLEQMERALSEEDPKFASTLRGTSLRRAARRRAVAAWVGFALGVAVLMTGAVAQLWYVGVIGFLVMLAGATVALTAMRGPRRSPLSADPRATAHPDLQVLDGGRRGGSRRPRRTGGTPKAPSTRMQRIEERWRRRREQGGF